MEWTKAQTGEDDFIKIPPSWLLLHYYEALTVLFRIENSLRVFVYVVLKDKNRTKWSDLTISSDDGNETTIAAIARKRIAQDEKFGYLGYRITSPLMHLTSGELIRIILADTYWPWFADHFPATKDIVRTKLEEIGNIRNALAHFRPIKSDDAEVVKQNANQILSRVEDDLNNIASPTQPVPTNTADIWYGDLKTLAAPTCGVQFRQSENEEWIQVSLNYSCPIAGAPTITDDYRSYRVLTVNSSAILRRSPEILADVIFSYETVPWVSSVDPLPVFKKGIHFLFSRATLVEAHAVVRKELDAIIQIVSRESDLIREDNLAVGELVRAATTTASLRDDGRWYVDRQALLTPVRHNDPAEYWGSKPFWFGDFVTSTQSYPWMPVDISRFAFF